MRNQRRTSKETVAKPRIPRKIEGSDLEKSGILGDTGRFRVLGFGVEGLGFSLCGWMGQMVKSCRLCSF